MAKTTTPDDVRPEAKPHGTTADQVAEMEAEGQGQSPTSPVEANRTTGRPTADPDALGPESESAAEDQAIDTAGTGLIASDEDEAAS